MIMKNRNKLLICQLLVVGALLFLISSCKKSDDTGNQTVTDIDGNVYHTVTIGTQVWMVENLKVTRYNDGTEIPLVKDNYLWTTLSTPGYCWFKNDSATYGQTYGAMYNWYAVNTGKLCPAGWHVPTDAEWTTLTDYLGGLTVAGGKLKETGTLHWSDPNTAATNESKFNLVPAGYRAFQNGTFLYLNENCTLWSSTTNTSSTASSRSVSNNSGEVLVISNMKTYGISVRCIKN
jgi:uncharacterized protein (TIGR02145 family)